MASMCTEESAWVPQLRQQLSRREQDNIEDRFAITITKHSGAGDSNTKAIVGQMPKLPPGSLQISILTVTLQLPNHSNIQQSIHINAK